MPIRSSFPEAGSNYMDGESDGYQYTTIFSGSTLEASYDMLKKFLEEEGYKDLPIPSNAKELLLFKHPKGGNQIDLFHESGYRHNPIKIKFHKHRRKATTLILHLFNEEGEQHLLRFHDVL